MLLLLYRTPNGLLVGDTNSMTYSQTSMDLWLANHPGVKLLHVFDLDDDLNARNAVTRDDFIAHCNAYGLPPEAFGRRFTDSQNGHTMEVAGLIPNNRKYTVRVMDLTINRPMKCSSDYIRAHLGL